MTLPTDPNTKDLIWVFTAILLPMIPAFVLFKFLPSTGNISGPFQGFEIKLGGAFAGYFALVLIVYFWPHSKPRELAYEVWTLNGKILEEDGTIPPKEKVTLDTPRNFHYYDDTGVFQMDILVKRDESGHAKFPRLMANWEPAQPFGNATVPLDSKDPFFDKKYMPTVDEKSKEITILDAVKLKALPQIQAREYSPPNEPLPQPTTLPASAAPGTNR